MVSPDLIPSRTPSNPPLFTTAPALHPLYVRLSFARHIHVTLKELTRVLKVSLTQELPTVPIYYFTCGLPYDLVEVRALLMKHLRLRRSDIHLQIMKEE